MSTILKKIIALILAVAMLAALAACSKSEPEDTTTVDQSQTSETPPLEITTAAPPPELATTEPQPETPSQEATSGASDTETENGSETARTTPAPPPSTQQKVGIAMPTQSLQRWDQDGSNMRLLFEAAGYEVELQYGDNEVQVQVSQIENMIASGCSLLVIAAIDSGSLTNVLAGAKGRGIPVIAFDRLIMDTDAVSYYATFDNWKVGALQGQHIVDALDLVSGAGPFNIELFTCDPSDNNIDFFFDGAMSVLQPFIESGQLDIPSGQAEKYAVATVGGSTENARERMESLITANNYVPGGTPLHAVMCSNDSTAQGVTNALRGAGFDAESFPIITGQDCEIESVKNMIEGTQSMSVFKDTRVLAGVVVDMSNSILAGFEPPINDRATYNNNTGIIPSFLCEPVAGTIDNYVALLIESGYYKEDDLA